jgi:hypothetical protein
MKQKAYDCAGHELRLGDVVQDVDFGPLAIKREVNAIGGNRHGGVLKGCVRVQGKLGWHHGRHFRKVRTS